MVKIIGIHRSIAELLVTEWARKREVEERKSEEEAPKQASIKTE